MSRFSITKAIKFKLKNVKYIYILVDFKNNILKPIVSPYPYLFTSEKEAKNYLNKIAPNIKKDIKIKRIKIN